MNTNPEENKLDDTKNANVQPLNDEKLESVDGGFILSTAVIAGLGYGAKKIAEACGVDVDGAVKKAWEYAKKKINEHM